VTRRGEAELEAKRGDSFWLQAAVQGDPLDGLLAAPAEALACLAGFAVFARYLHLRR
jgi:hypothetical protein